MYAPPDIPDHEIHLPPVGEGTFGTVYRATYRGTQERAVKVFRRGLLNLMQMQRELEKISLAAEHPNVVTLYGFDLSAEIPWCAMGLHADRTEDGVWRGRTLDSLCGRVGEAEAERLLALLADALAYLHSIQVIHCDVKPSNVLLTDEAQPRPVLCDFGQSRASGSGRQEMAGSPCYAAPEQLRAPADSAGGKGFRWDVYAFGVLAFRLATGRYPRLADLAEESGLESMERTLQDESEGPSAEEIASRIEQAGNQLDWGNKPALSRGWREIVERCLRVNPQQRFADLREVVAEADRRAQQRKLKRARMVALSLAILSALALLAGAFAWAQWQRSNTLRQQAEEARDESELARSQALAARFDAEGLISSMLYELTNELQPLGRLDLMSEVSDAAYAYYQNLPEDQRTPRSELQRVTMLNTRGEIFHSAGRIDEAQQALAAAAALLEASPLPAEQTESERIDNLVQRARVWHDLGETERGLEALDAFLASAPPVEDLGPEGIHRRAALLMIYSELLDQAGQLDQAHAKLAQTLELTRRLESGQLNGYDLRLISLVEGKFATSLLFRGELAEAQNHFQAAWEALEAIPAPERSGQWEADVGNNWAMRSDVARLEGDLPQALKYARQAVALFRIQVESNPLEQNAKINLAGALEKQGVARLGLDLAVQAVGDLEECVGLLDQVVAQDPENLTALARRVSSSGQLVSLLILSNQPERAAQEAVKRVASARALWNVGSELIDNRLELVDALTRAARALRASDPEQAEELAREGVELAEGFPPAVAELRKVRGARGDALAELAESRFSADDLPSAAELWGQAWEVLAEANFNYSAALALLYRADALSRAGEAEAASEDFQRAAGYISKHKESGTLSEQEVELLEGFLPVEEEAGVEE